MLRISPTGVELLEITLETSSWVAGRGVRHVSWSVRVGDAWVPIRDLREVARTIADPDIGFDDDVDELSVLPRGCQYRITHHLRVGIGTRLQKRISVPLEIPRARPALDTETTDDALRRIIAALPPSKPRLKTTVVEFRVARHGTLITEEEWQRRNGERRRRPPARRATTTVSTSELEAFTAALREELRGAMGGS
jgi:hypothetical protein